MSKRHYELIAAVVNADLYALDPEQRAFVARAFADRFAADNSRFNRATFLRACGVEVDA